MTNKTPLTELIEWMDKEVLQGNVSTIKAKANELKAKEKNIIVDAYERGHTDQFYGENRKETYYEQNFKND